MSDDYRDAPPDTDFRTLQDKKYMGAWDLQGADRVSTIVRITLPTEIVGDGGKKSKKSLAFIKEFHKPIIMNATNMKTIASMYGPKVGEWIGARITLYVGQTEDRTKGTMVDCIRIRPQIPRDVAPPPARAPRGRPALNAPTIDVTADVEREAIEAES